MALCIVGFDILGPFLTGTGQMKFLVVGIDYFIKWVEAEPLAKITQQNVKELFLEEHCVQIWGIEGACV